MGMCGGLPDRWHHSCLILPQGSLCPLFSLRHRMPRQIALNILHQQPTRTRSRSPAQTGPDGRKKSKSPFRSRCVFACAHPSPLSALSSSATSPNYTHTPHTHTHTHTNTHTHTHTHTRCGGSCVVQRSRAGHGALVHVFKGVRGLCRAIAFHDRRYQASVQLRGRCTLLCVAQASANLLPDLDVCVCVCVSCCGVLCAVGPGNLLTT